MRKKKNAKVNVGSTLKLKCTRKRVPSPFTTADLIFSRLCHSYSTACLALIRRKGLAVTYIL